MKKNLRIAKQLVRIAKMLVAQDNGFNPSAEMAFSNPYNAGDGVVIYEVEDSKEGQLAVRKAVDASWGYDRNPWAIIARNRSNEGDELKDAWKYWKHYSAYPKRIAFKGGKLLGISAGDDNNYIEWWDKNDKVYDTIPGTNAMDDMDFLERYGKLN